MAEEKAPESEDVGGDGEAALARKGRGSMGKVWAFTLAVLTGALVAWLAGALDAALPSPERVGLLVQEVWKTSEAAPQTDEACVRLRQSLRRTPAAAPLRGVKPPS